MVVPTAAAVGTTRQQTASSSRMSQLSSKMDGCMLLKQQRCTKRVSVPQRGAGVCVQAFFNFNKGAAEESNESSLSRGDFDVQEVEDYFNYMGMLAAEGNYDRLDAMLSSGLEPVDLLLLMACSENDTPKVEEVLKAGADINVKDLNGKSPMELCTKEEVKELLQKAGA